MSPNARSFRLLAVLWIAAAACRTAKTDAASTEVPPIVEVQVQVAPAVAQVHPGDTVDFVATVTGAADPAVTWSVQEGATGGGITSTGRYTAPGAAGQYHVVATSVADTTKSGVATVTVTATSTGGTLASQLEILAGKAIFFGHQSVGANLIDGVETLLAANTGPEPTIVHSSSPTAMGAGKWAENYNGANYDPAGKIDAFKATMQGGVGAVVDIAFMKFCWVDFDDDSSWFKSGTGTVGGLFDRYQAMVAALHASFPTVKLVHFTAPLYVDTERNIRREAYNALVRSTYGGLEPVFDLALLESTDPSGNRVIGTYGPALYPGYTSDGGHLDANTAQGRDRIAAALVALLASL